MTVATTRQPREPIQVTGELLSVKRAGAYHHLTIVAEGIAERTRPGTFLAVAVGDGAGRSILRRSFWIHRVRPSGAYGGTVEIVLEPRGTGTRWLSRLRQHDPVDIVGPLGRPFAQPAEPVACVVVGNGHGSAPLFLLAEQLRERGCAVHMVLGAATESRLLGTLEARRTAKSVTVTTDDGSVDTKGPVTAPLAELLERTGSAVVYASGPSDVLAAVARVAGSYGAWSQCAVETSMGCGTGVCMGCVLPVVGADGIMRMVRSCVEGPVFRGDRVGWEGLAGAAR